MTGRDRARIAKKRRVSLDEPNLATIFHELSGSGGSVRDEYVRRFRAWHSATCGGPVCRAHLPEWDWAQAALLGRPRLDQVD